MAYIATPTPTRLHLDSPANESHLFASLIAFAYQFVARTTVFIAIARFELINLMLFWPTCAAISSLKLLNANYASYQK